MEMKFGLLGERLSHSYSKIVHEKIADYDYQLFSIPRAGLDSFLKSESFRGLNVTIPYKKDVIPYCSWLSPEAERIGAVNTIIRTEKGLWGYNTDYFGFAYMAKKAGIGFGGKKTLVLGSGGTSLTACAVAEDFGARVTVVSRTGEINYQNLPKDAELLINTTPVGMYPNNDGVIALLSSFTRLEGVLDVIYNPSRTRLLLEAESRGLPSSNGLIMLVAQAKAAAEIFLGRKLDDSLIDKVTSEIEKEALNIALIGMPGCGKSSIGEVLAHKTGRELIDIDAEIEKQEGRSIPEIFAERGEAFFREIEALLIQRHAKESGKIIVTGGGAVLSKDNVCRLKQNSTVVFIKRAVDKLDKKGRPLSTDIGAVKNMYKIRLPLYKSAADIEAENTGIEQTAQFIFDSIGI